MERLCNHRQTHSLVIAPARTRRTGTMGSNPEDEGRGSRTRRRRLALSHRQHQVGRWTGDHGVVASRLDGMHHREVTAPARRERRQCADTRGCVIATIGLSLASEARPVHRPAVAREAVVPRLYLMSGGSTKLCADHGHGWRARENAEQDEAGDAAERAAHDPSIADRDHRRDRTRLLRSRSGEPAGHGRRQGRARARPDGGPPGPRSPGRRPAC